MPIIAEHVTEAWRSFVAEKVAAGWKPYLLTFMFGSISGSEQRRLHQMAHNLEIAYGIFVTRCERRPHALGRDWRLPLWLCSPDLPVWKHEKKELLLDLRINDGLHFHAILLLPPWSRLEKVAEHFIQYECKYRDEADLRRVHVEPIVSFERDPVGYVQKQGTRGHFDVGENFVLPRPVSELPAPRLWLPPRPRLPGERQRPTVLSAIRR